MKLDDAIEHYMDASRKYADARALEDWSNDTRAVVKHTSIMRLLGTENPQTNKPHSASSAEASAVLDPAYATHLEYIRDSVVARILAESVRDAAWARMVACSLEGYHVLPIDGVER